MSSSSARPLGVSNAAIALVFFAATGYAVFLSGCSKPIQPKYLDDDEIVEFTGDEQASANDGISEEEKALSKGRVGGIWVRCYQGFSPNEKLNEDLGRLTLSCGKPTGLIALTPVKTGKAQHEQDPVERFQFHAVGGRCYRVFAVGDTGVADLDVALVSDAGKLIVLDKSQGRSVVLPARGPVCVDKTSTLSLEVSVARGQGAFVLQVWSDS